MYGIMVLVTALDKAEAAHRDPEIHQGDTCYLQTWGVEGTVSYHKAAPLTRKGAALLMVLQTTVVPPTSSLSGIHSCLSWG